VRFQWAPTQNLRASYASGTTYSAGAWQQASTRRSRLMALAAACGRTEEARDIERRILASGEERMASASWLADAYASLDLVADAERLCEIAQSADEKNDDLYELGLLRPMYARLGREADRRRVLDAWNREYDALIAKDPRAAGMYRSRATTNAVENGDLDLVEKDLARIRELEPLAHDVVTTEAWLRLRRKDANGAVKLFERAMTEARASGEDGDAVLDLGLGLALAGDGRRADALPRLRRGLAGAPEHYVAAEARAVLEAK
jgi:tetratricopeptide (TPR) repeat protein